jgi:hypothetical protein
MAVDQPKIDDAPSIAFDLPLDRIEVSTKPLLKPRKLRPVSLKPNPSQPRTKIPS